MSALTFTLKKSPASKLDCRQLTPNLLANLTIAEIKNIPLSSQKNAPKVADFFEVTGDDVQTIHFNNATAQLDYIGHHMTKGTIVVEGDCGDYLGANMQGGTIIVKGCANDRLGDQMRRGLILIDGNAGDYCASRMIAGTIGVYGTLGKHVGFAMKRGTILLTQTPKLHATMQNCGTHTLPFLALLFRAFTTLPTMFNTIQSHRVQRYAGDLACDGRGEILVFSSR